ncbi:hypothetical protein M434DRAFT_33038 [Hypoxylon sp. CO27-5]|nr:hypothetical protein M434DRAFT_33038 [Hypoxylon sp. CO27-5]
MSGIRFAPSPTQRTRLVSRDSVPVLSPGSDHARRSGSQGEEQPLTRATISIFDTLRPQQRADAIQLPCPGGRRIAKNYVLRHDCVHTCWPEEVWFVQFVVIHQQKRNQLQYFIQQQHCLDVGWILTFYKRFTVLLAFNLVVFVSFSLARYYKPVEKPNRQYKEARELAQTTTPVYWTASEDR